MKLKTSIDSSTAPTDAALSRRDFLSAAGTGSAVAVGAGILLVNPLKAIAGTKENSSAGHAATPAGWSNSFHPASAGPLYPPRDAPKPGEKIHEFNLNIGISVHEPVPGVRFHGFTYNGSYPAPEIRVQEGDWILANLTNNTPEFHTIHWHGIMLANEMDGVPNGTQWGTGPGQTFKYLFRAQPAGTHFYHCHNMTNLHVQAGMFGALIIEPKEDLVKKVFPYTRDYTLLLSEVDTTYIEQQMEEMLRMMTTPSQPFEQVSKRAVC